MVKNHTGYIDSRLILVAIISIDVNILTGKGMLLFLLRKKIVSICVNGLSLAIKFGGVESFRVTKTATIPRRHEEGKSLTD
ncbi:MAG: hypothetical protein LBT09_14715 [Planctomycetaceae bacterium]|nr:hypothetical protein [Planctomycetaceae bacterium]